VSAQPALCTVFRSGALCHIFPIDFLSPRAAPCIVTLGGCEMDYEIDLDPAHSIIRLTITAETVTFELAEGIYRHLSEATSSGGPYAAIYDLSATKQTSMPAVSVRGFARRKPSIPMGRPHVVEGEEPVIFGLARVFQMCGEAVGSEHHVVHPEGFTECLIWPCEWVSRSPTSPGRL
jgi:hypothetical protein